MTHSSGEALTKYTSRNEAPSMMGWHDVRSQKATAGEGVIQTVGTKVRGCAAYDFWESRVERANSFLSNLSKFFDDGQNCRSPFGVRIITLLQLHLYYYMLLRYETQQVHKWGYGLCTC